MIMSGIRTERVLSRGRREEPSRGETDSFFKHSSYKRLTMSPRAWVAMIADASQYAQR